MTFAEIPEASWFYLPRDPDKSPLFKCTERDAIDRQYRQLLIAGTEDVVPVESTGEPHE